MQLTCKVNQAEAIRRGFDANSTIKLEIDNAALTPEERATLADNFSSGEFKQGYNDRQIPEPTFAGFLETLRQLVADAAEKKAAEAKSHQDRIANAGENFRKRTTHNYYPELSANLIDGEVKLCERYAGDNATRVVLSYTRIEPHKEYESDATEWSRLLATPEGVAWQAELDTLNAAAKAKAETDVIAAFHEKAQRRAEKAARMEDFRQWALAHGSETLRLRVEDNFKWQDRAAEEWTDAMLAKAGITDAPLPTTSLPGYDSESVESEQPTAAQIKNLRRIRQALAALPDVPAEIALRDFTYTEEIPDEDNMGQDPDVITRTEVRVDITTPTGSEVTRYFIA